MSDNYNIDDILSEVKKRREETEQQIKEGREPEPEAQEPTPELIIDKPEPVVESIEPDTPPAPTEEVPADDDVTAEDQVDAPPAEEVELTLTGDDFEPREEEEIELSFCEEDMSHTADMPEIPEEDTAAAEDEMVDMLHMTDTDPQEMKEQDSDIDKKLKKRGKIIRSVLIALIVLVIGAIVFGVLYANNALNTMSGDNGLSTEGTWDGMGDLVETFEPFDEVEASELSSLQDMIKTWYYTGTPVKSTHVLNVMLIGEDTRGSEIKEEGTRADSAIIASINIDTQEIHLTSILRDTYAYWENTPGDPSTGQFGKINGAMSLGSVDAYINCVEHLYKVDIDNYVIVNFDSFKSIVDTMGGVTLELTSREINEINSHPKRYNHTTIEKTFDGDKGEMKLDGKQALAYCRIRKLDSDNMRANRQKICLTQIFKQAKDASPAQLIKIVNSLIPYVKTGYSKSSVVKIAKYALTNGWTSFAVDTANIPDSRINERGAGGIFYGTWCWKSDFPQDAYDLQMRMYGKSNITLAHQRIDVLKCALTGFRSEGAAPASPTFTNDNYGVVSTTAPTTDEQ